MAKNNQLVKVENVTQGIQAVDARIAEIQHINESVYKTSGKLDGFPKNLKDETDTSTLIKMYSSVKAREDSYNSAAEELGFKSYPSFKIDGATAEDWAADVKLRVNIVQHKEKLDKLLRIKKEYTELMDKQDRMAILETELANL